MKLVIIEGPDNCGKNTLINKLSENFEIVKIVHCGKPKGETDEDKALYQHNYFQRLCEIAVMDSNTSTDATIHNRSWYGEYVYGPIYRNTDKKFIEEYIKNIEESLLTSFKPEDIYYIQLMSSSVELLAKNDDNLSLSNANTELIKTECEQFTEIFNKSILNKKMIYVNEGDNFRPFGDIYQAAIEFISA